MRTTSEKKQTQNFMVDMAAPVITYKVYKITEDDIETPITGSDTATSINLKEGKGFKLKGEITDGNGIKTYSIKINGSDEGVSIFIVSVMFVLIVLILFVCDCKIILTQSKTITNNQKRANNKSAGNNSGEGKIREAQKSEQNSQSGKKNKEHHKTETAHKK